VVHYIMEYYSAIQKEFNNMFRNGDFYVNWSKLVT
jgi:hypothetical protein